jgi:hypothetical protein
MFKKLINIVMSVVLLISTMGFTVSKHYCGDELVNFSIDSEAKSCCDMSDGCCHTESEHFKLKEDFVGQFVVNDFQDFSTDVLFPIYFFTLNFELGEEVKGETEFSDLSPPPKVQTTLSLLQTYLC